MKAQASTASHALAVRGPRSSPPNTPPENVTVPEAPEAPEVALQEGPRFWGFLAASPVSVLKAVKLEVCIEEPELQSDMSPRSTGTTAAVSFAADTPSAVPTPEVPPASVENSTIHLTPPTREGLYYFWYICSLTLVTVLIPAGLLLLPLFIGPHTTRETPRTKIVTEPVVIGDSSSYAKRLGKKCSKSPPLADNDTKVVSPVHFS